MKKLLAVFLSCMLLVGTMQIASAAESVPMSPLDGLKYLTEEASADAVVKAKPVKAPVKNAPAKASAGTPGVEDEEGTENPLADPGDSGENNEALHPVSEENLPSCPYFSPVNTGKADYILLP